MWQELEQRMMAEQASGTYMLYYYSVTGEDVRGPLEEWQLFNLWHAGKIKTDILVCEEGSQVWRPWLTKHGEEGIWYFPPPEPVSTAEKYGATPSKMLAACIAAIIFVILHNLLK